MEIRLQLRRGCLSDTRKTWRSIRIVIEWGTHFHEIFVMYLLPVRETGSIIFTLIVWSTVFRVMYVRNLSLRSAMWRCIYTLTGRINCSHLISDLCKKCFKLWGALKWHTQTSFILWYLEYSSRHKIGTYPYLQCVQEIKTTQFSDHTCIQ